MPRKYYSASIKDFLMAEPETVLGLLLIHDEFATTDLQKNAWCKEIEILQAQMHSFNDGEIAFEYTIPRIGHRIDVVCIIRGMIFLFEFKVGEREYKKASEDQIMDYALDLKYFHEMSSKRYIIPINVSTEAPASKNKIVFMEDRIAQVLSCNKENICETITDVLNIRNDRELKLEDWINSRYVPTPTIIEAAQVMYRNHSVKDISRNDAGANNLTVVTDSINKIIDDCRRNKKKAVCFITGVPGAGKTLAGLNIANECHNFEDDAHAVFLSGNGPLVDVLQEALARDMKQREGVSIDTARQKTKSFIQIIHKFRDEAITTSKPPVEKITIYDEAQRAWDKASLTKFMEQKKNIAGFDQSEPEFLIHVMDRHKDWAIIICLVGGGQEIHTGEAGIKEWFDALKKSYPNWHIYLSDKLVDSEYVGNSTIRELLNGSNYFFDSSLHLGVSLRSFRSEKLAEFIKDLLDNKPDDAAKVYSELSKTYPIVVTRDFNKAQLWVKNKARGTERYGLLASSSGKRLRGVGIWVPQKINHVSWFLDGKNYIDSSYSLEIAASEFKVQGLEIDYGLLAWDADFRRSDGEFVFFKLRGNKWTRVNIPRKREYLKNAYRVLLTRARQGMVIFVPEGTDKSVDPTRSHEIYDDIYNYLCSCGIKVI